MNVDEFIENLLMEVCMDDGIKDGVFDINNTSHRAVLYEHIVDKYGNEIAGEIKENKVILYKKIQFHLNRRKQRIRKSDNQ